MPCGSKKGGKKMGKGKGNGGELVSVAIAWGKASAEADENMPCGSKKGGKKMGKGKGNGGKKK